MEPSTGISCAHRRGTRPRPIRLAASAGNADRRSCVAVKNTLTRSAPVAPLRSSIVARSRSVAPSTASAESSATRMAPRAARTLTSSIAEPRRAAAREQATGRRAGSQPRRAIQGLHLPGRELPDLAWREPAQPEGALTNANEAPHGEPHRSEHPTNLPLAPLPQHQPHGPTASRSRHGPDLQGSGDAVLELHPAPETGELARGGSSLHLGQILLLHAVPRMRQPLRQLAVVREQQQPLGVPVQPSDGE